MIAGTELECKPATVRSYEQLLRVHVTPRFGQKRLSEINRDQIKDFIAELSVGNRFSRNTLR